MFQRYLEPKIVESLLANRLFRDRLLPDIQRGVVFPAIRGGYIDFYFRGGRLFTFRKEFSTHKKYASVMKSDRDYVFESDLHQKIQLIQDFSEGYEQIKENCSLYAGEEAKGVSSIYHKYPFVKKSNEIVVLDIEVSLKAQSEDKKQDRIDLLLFNQMTCQLKCYEAKHFSNGELWATTGTQPKVISQLQRYETQIEREANKILEQYCRYADIMNQLFGCDLPEPKGIDEKTVLLVFGFDRDQLQGRLKKLLLDDKSLEGIFYYFVGDISKANINNMWNEIKCG